MTEKKRPLFRDKEYAFYLNSVRKATLAAVALNDSLFASDRQGVVGGLDRIAHFESIGIKEEIPVIWGLLELEDARQDAEAWLKVSGSKGAAELHNNESKERKPKQASLKRRRVAASKTLTQLAPEEVPQSSKPIFSDSVELEVAKLEQAHKDAKLAKYDNRDKKKSWWRIG